LEQAEWSLDRIRAEIDRIDEQILRLLERRASLALLAKREKLRQGLPVEDLARERQVIEQAARSCRDPLSPAEARTVFEAIVACCRRVQAADSGMEVPSW